MKNKTLKTILGISAVIGVTVLIGYICNKLAEVDEFDYDLDDMDFENPDDFFDDDDIAE